MIGKDPRIDDGVLLGYPPERTIQVLPTKIGNFARIRSNTVIYTNTTIGDSLDIGHGVIIREENTIGDNFSIWAHSIVDYGCKIGKNVKIHSLVYICQYTEIADDVFIGPGVMFANDPHPVCAGCMKGPTIKRGARIGMGVIILPRVTIGEGALIGAGSIVTRDVPPGRVVYGNPARIVGRVEKLRCKYGLKERPYTP